MTQRPDDTRLHGWLDETVGQTPDPVEGTQQVMSQIEETAQVGRWLPFPVLHRKAKAKPPTTNHTTEYQSSPITTATNGRAPTVIGRTQTMLSPAKAITAGVLVFALGGVLLIAQPFDPQSEVAPGAATDSPVAAYVHGTLGFPSSYGDGVETYDDEGNRLTIRNMEVSGTTTFDDPRLQGTYSQVNHGDEFPQQDTDERVEVWWSEVRIENDGGTWSGTTTSTYDSDQPIETAVTVFQLTGEGGYEGLSALLFNVGEGEVPLLAGAIFSGDLPPR